MNYFQLIQIHYETVCSSINLRRIYFFFGLCTRCKKKKDKVTFFVEGMECANCQKKVEKNISFEKGVTDMKCDLTTRTVEVTYKTDKTSKTKLASAFKKIGMEAVPVDDGAGCPVSPAKKN